jgi:hypothetical protein
VGLGAKKSYSGYSALTAAIALKTVNPAKNPAYYALGLLVVKFPNEM